jgi:hypothetical protein
MIMPQDPFFYEPGTKRMVEKFFFKPRVFNRNLYWLRSYDVVEQVHEYNLPDGSFKYEWVEVGVEPRG